MKRFLAVLLALGIMSGTVSAALAAAPSSESAAAEDQKGYYGSRLTDHAAIAFYQALETMDFASGKNLTITDSAVLELAESFASGSDKLIRSFGAAVDSFRYDHTEFFYVDWDMLSVNVGRKSGKYVVNIGTGRTDSYLRDKTADIAGQTAAYDAALENVVESVRARIDADASVKAIAEAANNAVCGIVTYDFCDNADGSASAESKYIRTTYGALVNGRAVCEGYSRLYKAVLNKLGVECELVSGYYIDGESFEPHMWNYVQDEKGDWYAVDVTMNDGHRLNGSYETNFDKYFWQTEELFAIDHIEDGKVSSVEYEMPYPELHKFWATPTDSGRFKSGMDNYDGNKVFWFSFDGKSAEELLEEDGLYMAFRTATTNTGELIWQPWTSVQEYNKHFPGMIVSDKNEHRTYFLGQNIAVPILEAGVFDIPDDHQYSQIARTYSEEAVMTHLIESHGIENPSHDPDYIAPAFIKRAEPEGLFQRMHDITQTQHIVLEYDMPLRAVEDEEGNGFYITWGVSSYNNRDLNLETVQKNAKLENVKFDGNRTISFDFTPSRAFNHNMLSYDFTPRNIVNVISGGKDGVPLRGFSITYEYTDDIACCKIYNDGRLYMNTYAQPSIAMNGDLSMTDWTYTDTDGSPKQVSESQRSQMALVVTRPNDNEELAAAATKEVGSAAAVKATTYEIDLNICGKLLQIPNGSYMRLNLGIPDEFADLVGKEDIKFKLYHFKRDDSTGKLDYEKTEEIECVLTPYGLIAEVHSFSPYVLVAVDNSKLPAEEQDTSKSLALVCNGHGGKVMGGAVETLQKNGSVTYALTPDKGYDVEFVRLNGQLVKLDGNTITLAYEDIESSNTLEVGFVAKSVKEAEAAEEIVNVTHDTTCTVTFESNSGSAVEPVYVESGKAIEEPTAPTRDGYRFDGWYTDHAFTHAFDFSTQIVASITLYAKWTKEAAVDPDPVDPDPVDPDPIVPDDQPAAWENPFADVKEHSWYYGSVQFAVKNGLFRGTSNTTFDPNGDMTRQMLATVLYRLAKEPETGADQSFSDVAEGQYYTEAVIWAAEKGIVSGYGDGKFGPGDLVTREQLAVMLWRYAGKPAGTGKLDSFTDAADVHTWAMDALRWAVEQKIVNGRSDGMLDPKGNATRAEVATMLMRYCETLK